MLTDKELYEIGERNFINSRRLTILEEQVKKIPAILDSIMAIEKNLELLKIKVD